MSCDNIFNSGKFHNLEKDYYKESSQGGTSAWYNTYEDFILGSKTDSSLKLFEYEDPFAFIPSYGSSVEIDFINNNLIYENGYVNSSISRMNNVNLSFNLKFNNRSESEADSIVKYLNSRKGFKKFPFQPIPRDIGMSSENAHKSLYSLFPYFAQEFICNDVSITHEYLDNVSISTNFSNGSYSILNIRNILEMPSQSIKQKNIIEEYRNKKVLDIEPSYSVSREIVLKTKKFVENKSTIEMSSDGINEQENVLDLKFDSIDDNKLLKLLSFFINKMAIESFLFKIRKPDEKTLNFICIGIKHTYVFKGVHNLSVTIIEKQVECKFKNKI